MTLLTIGHSVRPIATLLDLLEANGVRRVADVRLVPRSRRHPQFGAEPLAASLASRGIEYFHLPALGGMRVPRPDSRHVALRDAFRGYADHMETPEFEKGVAALLEIAEGAPTAFLCAEADPASCHRSLLADLLTVRGATVEHIVDSGPRRLHAFSRTARREGNSLVYDVGPGRLRLET